MPVITAPTRLSTISGSCCIWSLTASSERPRFLTYKMKEGSVDKCVGITKTNPYNVMINVLSFRPGRCALVEYKLVTMILTPICHGRKP